MKRRKRAPGQRLIGSLGVAAALSLTGSLGPAAVHAARPAAHVVTLRFASWDPDNLTSTLVAPCLTLYPNIHVIREQTAYATYFTKLQTEFAAGTAPDIIQVDSDTLEWSHEGLILDQLPYRRALGLPVRSLINHAAWYDGTKFLGSAASTEFMYLYYNKDVFNQAHLAPPPSDVAHAWTWPQFVAEAKKLTIDRHGRHPDDPGFDPNRIQRFGVSIINFWNTILPLVYSNGGNIFDKSYSHFTMNQPAAAAAIQAWADLAYKYHVMPTPTQSTAGAGTISLATGRVGMEINGQWAMYFYQHPKTTFNLGIGVLPVLKQYRSMIFSVPQVVWAKTAHPREAVEMAACIAGDRQTNYSTGALGLMAQGLSLGNTTDLLYGKSYAKWAVNSLHPSNYQSVVVDTVKYGVPAPFYNMTKFTPAWNNVIAPALDRIVNGAPAQQVLTSIKPQVDAILAQQR